MKIIIQILTVILLSSFWSLKGFAETNKSISILPSLDKVPFYLRNFSMSYISFFDGPGIFTDDQSVTPNAIGRPNDDGLLLNNNVSLKYNLNKDYALDFQMRTQWVTNNGVKTDDFDPLRWQSPRFGISTTFLKTENGKLTGAFNTDLPYFFPEPFGGGYIAKQRTTLLTPGFFAKYSWTPTNTRWSLFSLVQPRFFIYRNRDVAEPQYTRAGFSPRLKNELTLSFSPSANYAFTDKFGFRLGTEVIYKKLVASGWNPLNASQRVADSDSKAWRIQPLPIQTGLTYIFSPMFELSSFIQGFPIPSQRVDKEGRKASFEETVSIGAWLSGKLF